MRQAARMGSRNGTEVAGAELRRRMQSALYTIMRNAIDSTRENKQNMRKRQRKGEKTRRDIKRDRDTNIYVDLWSLKRFISLLKLYLKWFSLH